MGGAEWSEECRTSMKAEWLRKAPNSEEDTRVPRKERSSLKGSE